MPMDERLPHGHCEPFAEIAVVGGMMTALSHADAPLRPQLAHERPAALSQYWTVVAILSSLWFAFSWGYVEDDAFIHVEYARNLARGSGLVFDGLRVYGDSSPGWVLVVSALGALANDWVLGAKLASIVAFAWTMLVAFRVALPVCAGRESSALVFVTLLALNPYVLTWSFSGMESVAAMGCCLWLLAMPRRLAGAGALRVAALGLCAGCMALVRFELFALALLVIGSTLVRFRPARGFAGTALCGLCCALPLGAWTAFALSYFGALMPTTNAAKRVGEFSLDVLLSSAVRLISVVGLGVGTAVLAAAVIILRYLWKHRPWRQLRRTWGAVEARMDVVLLAAWPLALGLLYLLNGIAVQTRYALLIGAPLLLFVVVCLERSRWLSHFVVASLVTALAIDISMVVPSIRNNIQTVEARAELSGFARQHLKSDAPIAVYGIGQLAVELPNPIVDTGGIMLPGSIASRGDREARLRWVHTQGALCMVDGDPPAHGFRTVHAGHSFRTGWMSPARYAEATPLLLHCRTEALLANAEPGAAAVIGDP